MELKLGTYSTAYIPSGVLIVPSGIETDLANSFGDEVRVLIVPSGIETHTSRIGMLHSWEVLIVPSGIETLLISSSSFSEFCINCT